MQEEQGASRNLYSQHLGNDSEQERFHIHQDSEQERQGSEQKSLCRKQLGKVCKQERLNKEQSEKDNKQERARELIQRGKD